MPRGEVNGGVKRGGEAAEQGNGRLSATFLDALDIVLGHSRPRGDFGDGEAELDTDVIQSLAEGESLADRYPLGVVGGFFGAYPAGVEPVIVTPAFRRTPLPDCGGRARTFLRAESPVDLPVLVLAASERRQERGSFYQAVHGTLPGPEDRAGPETPHGPCRWSDTGAAELGTFSRTGRRPSTRLAVAEAVEPVSGLPAPARAVLFCVFRTESNLLPGHSAHRSAFLRSARMPRAAARASASVPSVGIAWRSGVLGRSARSAGRPRRRSGSAAWCGRAGGFRPPRRGRPGPAGAGR